MTRIVLASAGGAAALLFGLGCSAATNCAPGTAEPVDAIRHMYEGAMAGDRAKTLANFDTEAFMFDGGARFTPDGIMDVIIKSEAAGMKPVWTVEGVESHVSCDLAWAAWTNHATFTTTAGSTPKTYLESAVFVWRDGSWKVRFFHSTLVPAGGTQPNQANSVTK